MTGMPTMSITGALLFSVLLFADVVVGIRFHVPANGKKCLKDEIHKGKLVKGDWWMEDVRGHHTDIKITDARDQALYENTNNLASGVFSFSVEEYDLFEICFTNKLQQGGDRRDREIELNVKTGVEAMDYDKLAQVEKLKPLEKELRHLEDLSENIVNEFAYMRSREEQMRDTNESTHSRVLYFSVFSMLCLVGLATWQVLYLRKYFKSKKLID